MVRHRPFVTFFQSLGVNEQVSKPRRAKKRARDRAVGKVANPQVFLSFRHTAAVYYVDRDDLSPKMEKERECQVRATGFNGFNGLNFYSLFARGTLNRQTLRSFVREVTRAHLLVTEKFY